MAAAAPLLASAGASTALTTGSTLLSAYSSAQQGKADTQQAIGNARIDREAATSAVRRGRLEESQLSASARANQGAITASAAGGGIDPTSGSAMDLRMDSRQAAEMDLLTLRNNAAQEALGYTRRAGATLAQASADSKTRRNKQFSSLLTSGMELAAKLPKK